MNPATFELVKRAARTLLAHRDAGRHCDPLSVEWAEQTLSQNPGPVPQTPFDNELPKEIDHAPRAL